MSHKVLCVDDEPNVLQAYQRVLRTSFDVETAPGGAEGLKLIDTRGPFAVVVSDMRMPGMDGIQFLAAVKKKAPSTVRMMLTGNADQQTAIEAVNEGCIFRFLTKPCSPEALAKALADGIEQYQLIMAEKELLGDTLRGAVKVLNDVLALANPVAFGHATRIRDLVTRLCDEMKVEQSWECEVAAMLSQIGCVTIPPDTLDRYRAGKALLHGEMEMIRAHPAIGSELVANIPRLEQVSQSIAYQNKSFDGSGSPEDEVAGPEIPFGARVLKVALDYEAARCEGRDAISAMTQLAGHRERYAPDVFAALRGIVGFEESLKRIEITVKDLAPGMMLAEDVRTSDGVVVVAKGQEVTAALCQRIRNYSRHRRIEEPISALIRGPEPALAGAR